MVLSLRTLWQISLRNGMGVLPGIISSPTKRNLSLGEERNHLTLKVACGEFQ